MNLETYIIESERTVSNNYPEINARLQLCINEDHAADGLVTEIGELAEWLLYKKGRVNLKEEIGDTMWYIALFMRTVDFKIIGLPPAFKFWLTKYYVRWFKKESIILECISLCAQIKDIYKKHKFYGKSVDKAQLINYLSQLYIKLSNLLYAYDINIEDVMELNITKLRNRFPNKFTNTDAINRNVENELKDF